ncbi:YrvL family regulatory protein [Alkalibacterium kapii]|uniref:Uncharacterized protein n=1 Tax=Alkalibacterium kapii TaxID=426704 RepID=A0A511ARB9_9LACT|nr:YrvL family regulatory protein [Alkalibacterium kapii]GEK90755.1 hypothetical protein AKA01nite_03770 [Alkalibacterium kapii]
MKDRVLKALAILLLLGIIFIVILVQGLIYTGSVSLLGINYESLWVLITFVGLLIISETIFFFSIYQIPKSLYSLDLIPSSVKNLLDICIIYTISFLFIVFLDQVMHSISVPFWTKVLFPFVSLFLNCVLVGDDADVPDESEKLNDEILNKIENCLSSKSVFETVKMIKKEYPEISLVVIKKTVDKVHKDMV